MKKKVFRKIIIVLAISVIIGTEAVLFIAHEQKRQNMLAGEIYDAIDFNFNMIKIAAQTNNIEMFEKNINEAEEKVTEIEKLFFAKKSDENYVREIREYLDFLGNKKDFLNEVARLKNNILGIKTALKSSYGEQEKVQKETFKNVTEEIGKQKLSTEEFSFEKTKQVADTTNEMIDRISGKTSELANCIGVCYKDAITKINNELMDEIKSFNEKTGELNSRVENEFNFEMIDKIKSERPRSL